MFPITRAPLLSRSSRRDRPATWRRLSTRCVAAAVAVAAMLFAMAPTDSVGAARAQDPASIESQFVALINGLRTSRGLAPLTVDAELTVASRSWAARMVAAGHISHAGDLSSGVSSDWAKLGENVGEGNEIGPLFDAFVASATHLENLVDPSFTKVGVGVVVNSEGRIFTTHRFMALRSVPPPPPAPAPQAPAPPAPVEPEPVAPVAAPVTPVPPTSPSSTVPVTTPSAVTTTTTTVPAEPVGKLGPLRRVAELLAD